MYISLLQPAAAVHITAAAAAVAYLSLLQLLMLRLHLTLR